MPGLPSAPPLNKVGASCTKSALKEEIPKPIVNC